MLVPRNVLPALAGFVELAFLKDMDEVWNVPGTSKNILRDSVEHSFSDIDVLGHTSVLLFHQPCAESAPRVEEYALSSRHRPWGFPLPSCPTCGNGNVVAPIKVDGYSRATCLGCGARTPAPGVKCEQYIHNTHHPQDAGREKYAYGWKPMHLESPWSGQQFVCKA
jgi:hypothetical protein